MNVSTKTYLGVNFSVICIKLLLTHSSKLSACSYLKRWFKK